VLENNNLLTKEIVSAYVNCSSIISLNSSLIDDLEVLGATSLFAAKN